MPGPPPKDPALRARANKKPTAGSIEATPVLEAGPAPTLPPRPADAPWHPLAVSFWTDVWASPMAKRYLQSDLHGLLVLVELVDQFWWKPSAMLSAEIRAVRQPYGLTPLDRNRLDWRVETPKPDEKPAPVAAPKPAVDPRKVLEMPARKQG